jgi:hypothetical protein
MIHTISSQNWTAIDRTSTDMTNTNTKEMWGDTRGKQGDRGQENQGKGGIGEGRRRGKGHAGEELSASTQITMRCRGGGCDGNVATVHIRDFDVSSRW